MHHINLGHMEDPVTPVHCVLWRESTTTSLQIVFDGSAHLPNKPSFNEITLRGPELQAYIARIFFYSFMSFCFMCQC